MFCAIFYSYDGLSRRFPGKVGKTSRYTTGGEGVIYSLTTCKSANAVLENPISENIKYVWKNLKVSFVFEGLGLTKVLFALSFYEEHT